MILSDSMSGRVHINQIKRNIDTNEESVIFKRFPGHTADEIRHYACKPLYDAKPSQVIVIAGTNDIQRDVQPGSTVNEHQVVEDLLAIARTAKEAGAEKIFVSAVMVRHGHQYRNPIIRVNNLLQKRCSEEGFNYMDQSDITSSHISMDGVHLNFMGKPYLNTIFFLFLTHLILILLTLRAIMICLCFDSQSQGSYQLRQLEDRH